MVPLTIPATRSTVSPASDWVSGRITGMAPATAASKYRSTWAFSAACASSPVDCGHQRLVGGDDGLALLQRGQDRLAGRFDRTHHLDDDVDVVTGDQCVDVVGQQLDRDTAVGGHPPNPDAAQHQRGTDAGGQVGRALLDDAHHLAAHIAQPQYGYADWLVISQLTAHPHFQTQQIVDRLAAQDQACPPVAHGHHGRTAEQVVPARHRIAVCAGGRDAQQVTRRDVVGHPGVADDDVAALAVLSDDPGQRRRRRHWLATAAGRRTRRRTARSGCCRSCRRRR